MGSTRGQNQTSVSGAMMQQLYQLCYCATFNVHHNYLLNIILFFIYFTDLNECVSGEAVCHGTALCENTYGGFKCICNGSVQLESQTCYSRILIYSNIMIYIKNNCKGEMKNHPVNWRTITCTLFDLINKHQLASNANSLPFQFNSSMFF